MKNKLLALAIILLGFFTLFCAVQSCCFKTQNLYFVNPPSSSLDWRKEFVLWPSIPVKVRVDGPGAVESISSDVVESIAIWNESIGCQVLAYSEDPHAEVVVSILAEGEDKDWVGSARFVHREHKGRKFWGSDVYVYNLYFKRKADRVNVMTHELGHVLGLADLKRGSALIMYWRVTDGTFIGQEVLNTLKRLYCAGP